MLNNQFHTLKMIIFCRVIEKDWYLLEIILLDLKEFNKIQTMKVMNKKKKAIKDLQRKIGSKNKYLKMNKSTSKTFKDHIKMKIKKKYKATTQKN